MKTHESMRTFTAALMLSALTSLAGCGHMIFSGGQKTYADNNEVPIATNYQTSTQLKLQASEHWRRVANASAGALIQSFTNGGACIPKNGCTTLYVRRNCETTGCMPQACDTTFNRVFFSEFLTALVTLGYQVSAIPIANAAIVDIDVQAVSFSANRPQFRYAGEAVELGKGIWALKDVASLTDQQGNLAPRTTGNDTFNWYRTEFAVGETPRNELVVTVSAMSPEKTYLARNTSIYYTSDSDATHYSCPKKQEVVKAPIVDTRTWTIPVTGDCLPPRCTTCAAPQCSTAPESKAR